MGLTLIQVPTKNIRMPVKINLKPWCQTWPFDPSINSIPLGEAAYTVKELVWRFNFTRLEALGLKTRSSRPRTTTFGGPRPNGELSLRAGFYTFLLEV